VIETTPRPASPAADLPADLTRRRLIRRLLQLTAAVGLLALIVVASPGLGGLRRDLDGASAPWLIAGAGLEFLSALSYVLIFHVAFCPRMGRRMSYLIGMAEQGANAALPASGAGGLALGAWALRRAGMGSERIASRSVAFFFLTSLANVSTLVAVGILFALGVLPQDENPALTGVFAAAAGLATVVVLALPRLLARHAPESADADGRLTRLAHFARRSLAQGVRDGLWLLRRRPAGVLAGSFGTMAFDIAVLAATFRAVGTVPPVGVLVAGYLIGQLGGNLPVPGGIGGVDAGLIGTFALYHQPLAATTAAVLLYHAIALWIPALFGGAAFVQLRRALERRAAERPPCERASGRFSTPRRAGSPPPTARSAPARASAPDRAR
jgi:uncharacterized membrane protein YbhN (UPF0104 family)